MTYVGERPGNSSPSRKIDSRPNALLLWLLLACFRLCLDLLFNLFVEHRHAEYGVIPSSRNSDGKFCACAVLGEERIKRLQKKRFCPGDRLRESCFESQMSVEIQCSSTDIVGACQIDKRAFHAKGKAAKLNHAPFDVKRPFQIRKRAANILVFRFALSVPA